MNKDARIYVAGHRGLVGSAVVRALQKTYEKILTADRRALDLTTQAAVNCWFSDHRPEIVIMCAAKVGGIMANATYPADFIGQNLMMQTNVLEAARQYGVRRVLFMASGCIYPRDALNPIREDALLTGPLEETNQWYAVAKIAGVKMAQAYRRQYGMSTVSVLPCNIYGPRGSFDLETSHVVPALLRKVHEAKVAGAPAVCLWGTGQARREFLHVNDLAYACVSLLEWDDVPELVNVGSGYDLTVEALARKIMAVVGYKGRIEYDPSKPDGTPRKLLDSSRMAAFGWKPRIKLEDGLKATYQWYRENGACRST